MKKFRKLLSVLMAALLFFAMVAPASSIGIDLDETIHTGGMNDLNVRQAARDYMDTRAAYLLGETETMEWLVTGIADDEAAHIVHLEENCILLTDISYDILSVMCSDTTAIVDVAETVLYNCDGDSSFAQVTHRLTILNYDTATVIVAADEYYEDFSGFISCSYVTPNDAANDTNSASGTNGSSLCIIQIAIGEDRTPERDVVNNTNDNKYGEDLGCNFAPWCSIFIRWCAVEANISDTVIPLRRFCKDLKSYYVNLGLYHPQKTNNVYYIPQPGDILFIGASEDNSTHVGIVEKFVDNEGDDNDRVWIIDGNSIDDNGEATQVNHRSVKLKRSDILGYASPLYASKGHTAATHTNEGDTHSGTCMNCNAAFEEAHEFHYNYDINNHWEECCDCGYVKNTAAHTNGDCFNDDFSHWYECTICGAAHDMEAHVYMTLVDGMQRCMTCNYIKSNSGGITPVPGLSDDKDTPKF